MYNFLTFLLTGQKCLLANSPFHSLSERVQVGLSGCCYRSIKSTAIDSLSFLITYNLEPRGYIYEVHMVFIKISAYLKGQSREDLGTWTDHRLHALQSKISSSTDSPGTGSKGSLSARSVL